MTSFKDELKKEFEAHQLSTDQLKELQKTTTKPEKSNLKFVVGAVLTACLLIVFIKANNMQSIRKDIAKEIAYNHNKQMNPEILTASYNKIRTVLDRLEFSVIDTSRLRGYKLIGARYCSIQGRTAAQIKVEDEAGTVFTLYQYQNDTKFDLDEQEIIVDGVRVKLWQEDGIHFGLAGPI